MRIFQVLINQKFHFSWFFIVFSFPLYFNLAYPCSCVQVGEKKSDQENLDNYDAIFEGRIVEVKLPSKWIGTQNRKSRDCGFLYDFQNLGIGLCQDEYLSVRFEVFGSWKGVDSQEVVILTNSQVTACGYDFNFVDTYLVFAKRDSIIDALKTSICDPTGPITKLLDVKKELGPASIDFVKRRYQNIK